MLQGRWAWTPLEGRGCWLKVKEGSQGTWKQTLKWYWWLMSIYYSKGYVNVLIIAWLLVFKVLNAWWTLDLWRSLTDPGKRWSILAVWSISRYTSLRLLVGIVETSNFSVSQVSSGKMLNPPPAPHRCVPIFPSVSPSPCVLISQTQTCIKWQNYCSPIVVLLLLVVVLNRYCVFSRMLSLSLSSSFKAH